MRLRRSGSALVLAVASLVAPPGAPAPADEVPPDAIVGDLPFDADAPSYRVILDLAPEGSARPFPLMLDTGASESILTPRMARALGVSVRRVKDSPYRRATRLGRDVSFWVDDRRSDTASRTGWEYGVLGGSFLEQFVVEIDFGARRVRFLDPDRYRVPETTPAEGEAVLPLRFPSKCPQVEIAIGEHRALVTLDTGAPHPFILAGKIAGPAGVEARAVPGLERGGTTVEDGPEE